MMLLRPPAPPPPGRRTHSTPRKTDTRLTNTHTHTHTLTEHGQAAQARHSKQLARLRLDALGAINEQQRVVRRRQRALQCPWQRGTTGSVDAAGQAAGGVPAAGARSAVSAATGSRCRCHTDRQRPLVHLDV
jgi:hypothetical protein